MRRTVPMRLTLMVLLVGLPLVAFGCGGGDDGGVADEPQISTPTVSSPGPTALPNGTGTGIASGDTVEVVVQGFRFQPSPLEIPVGTSVTWTNEDDITHTVTEVTPETSVEGFSLELKGQGAAVQYTFDESGSYDYYCTLHPSMLGQVLVR